jgi:gliding motility-associated-like protein
MAIAPLLPVSVSIVSDANPVCSGTAVTFTAIPVNGGTTPVYQWKVNGVNAGSGLVTFNYTPVSGDLVTCELTNSSTCVTGSPATSNIVTMTVTPSLPVSVSIAADVNPVCFGTAVMFTAIPVNEGTTPVYQWKVNGINAGAGLVSFSYTPDNGDVVTCELTSSATCVTGSPATSNAVTMTVNPLLPVGVTIAVDANPTCTGATVTFTATSTNSGLTPSYQWYNGVTAVGSNSPVYSYMPVNGDIISVVLTSSEICASGNPATSLPVTMTVNTAPTLSISDPASVGCSMATVDLTAPAVTVGSTPGLTYSYWTDILATVSLSDPDLVSVSGTYYIKGVDALTGCYDIKPVTVTANGMPSGTTVPVHVKCYGVSTGGIDLTVSGGTPGYTFLWNNGATTEDLTNVSAGAYSVLITDSYGCTFTALDTIDQPASALIVNTTKSDVNCFNAGTGSATAIPSGGTGPYSYSWNTVPVKTTATVTSLSAGTYTVTVTDANSCTSTADVTIIQPASALTVSTTKVDVLCFGGTTGTATVVASGGTGPYIYSWNTSPVQSVATATGLIAGSYIVTVTDSKGCSTTGTVQITEPAVLTIEEVHQDANCPGDPTGSITLTITGGTQPYSAYWSDGIRVIDRTDIPDGTYSVAITDKNGCAKSLNIVVGFTGSPECLEIPTVITPNNDGYNDKWVIKNIDLYPEAEVRIFNRWGELIFRTKNILADPWNGTFKGKLVPTDSYHYILYLNDGSDPKSGVISVIR